ncbi:MAG: L-threonylcarbamoyladenylate synthase [Pseudomonadota bacterium]
MSDKNATEVVLADREGIARAARILKSEGLVVVPTETVYGLTARADSTEAVAKIYTVKGRPDFNPLIVHVRSLEAASELALFDDRAKEVARRYWPGPLTLVLPLREDAPVAKAVTAGLPTIALRVPAHSVMQALLTETGMPLAAPSANRSEHISPTRPEHVITSLGDACPIILDGGPSEAGLESTIIALRPGGGWTLLRPGPIFKETLGGVLGQQELEAPAAIEAPGQSRRHYSPGKPMHLYRRNPYPGDFMIGFGDITGDVNLSPSGDKVEAAARLYECLHLAEAAPNPGISVASIHPHGMGRAINDRLERAAAPAAG